MSNYINKLTNIISDKHIAYMLMRTISEQTLSDIVDMYNTHKHIYAFYKTVSIISERYKNNIIEKCDFIEYIDIKSEYDKYIRLIVECVIFDYNTTHKRL